MNNPSRVLLLFFSKKFFNRVKSEQAFYPVRSRKFHLSLANFHLFEPSRIYRIEKIYQLGSISREGFGQTCLSTFRICTVQFSLVVMNHRCSSGYSSFNSWFDFNPLSLSLSLPTPQYSPLLLIVPFPFYLHTWKLAPTPKCDFLCPPNITKLLVCDDFDGRSRFYTSPVQTNVLQLRRRMADFEAVWAERRFVF